MNILSLLASLGAGFLIASLYYPAMGLGPRARTGVLVVVLAGVLAAPWIVPAEHRLLRFLASIAAVTFGVKVYDHHVGASLGHRPGFVRFEASLPNGLALVDRRPDPGPRPSAEEDRGRLLPSAVRLSVGLAAMASAFLFEWRGIPFLVEHAVKVTAFFLVLVPTSRLLTSALRLLGVRGIDPMANPFASRTPADFWRRYNRPVNHFFRADVFGRLDGRTAPIRATLAVFAVSAIIHEYVFLAPVGRVQGYQLAFFGLQGGAVAATWAVRPRGASIIPWVISTFAFNVATGVLFFASIAQVVPFYERGLPAWLAPGDDGVDDRSIGRNQSENSSSTAFLRTALATRAEASTGAIAAIARA
ncbi:MBOAT family protein [Tautonia plasticadhaerens]|uniref:MBOAT family protein n=1 Tax=Tautonia plasticadhaerens TaxID=2527974 RepID=A0A518H548_9BACT|nr:MBOAT family protein [Tautonia plasticadhaerens]